VTLALLVLALLGAPTNGTHRWLRLPGASFQPSELAKLAVLLFLAEIVARRQSEIAEPRGPILGGLVAAGVVVALVAVQPDLGTALAITMVTGALLFAAGMRTRYLLVPALLVLAAITVSVVFNDYQRGRIETFLNPDRDVLKAGYQVRQSKIAVGSGGFSGKGFHAGTQSQLRFLPVQHTDSILAVIAEEWGFLGVILVLGLFAAMLLRCLTLARVARDRGGVFLILALSGMMFFSVAVNASMMIGLLPTTGIPLPLVSYGGSSIATTLLAIGLILGVDFRRFANA